MPKWSLALLLALLLFPAVASADSGWLAPETVGAGPTGDFVAAEASGGGIVYAWTEAGAVRAGSRPPGGPWVAGVPVSNGTGSLSSPSVAIAPSGTAVVAWAEAVEPGKFAVRVALRSAAGTWAPPETVATTDSGQRPPVAIADDGEILVAWIAPLVRLNLVYVGRRAPAGTGNPTPSQVSLKSASDARLVMDGTGNATLVWRQASGGDGSPLGVAAATPSGQRHLVDPAVDLVRPGAVQ